MRTVLVRRHDASSGCDRFRANDGENKCAVAVIDDESCARLDLRGVSELRKSRPFCKTDDFAVRLQRRTGHVHVGLELVRQLKYLCTLRRSRELPSRLLRSPNTFLLCERQGGD